MRERGSADADTISNAVEISAQMVFRVAHELAKRGYQIVKDADGKFKLSSSEVKGPSFDYQWRPTTRILVWSGAELGSKGQQADCA